MQPDQIGALLTAAGIVIGSLAALITAIAGMIGAARKKDATPAPQVGIPAQVSDDDIDFRAYADAVARAERAEAWRDYWMQLAMGGAPTPPTDPGQPGSSS